ncbi:MAG TPA: glycine cleavage T C-terminal barrel domain-containing protein, partial [Rubrobacter sp.]|nr:glycine cleavage T C-terminal barrel domain-containing protein [Rubrobacter sp.]
LGFAVKEDKGDFLGREALLERKEAGPRRKLVCLVLDDPNVVVMGSEPVWAEAAVGYVTSADFGYSLGQSIAYAWVPPEHAGVGTRLEIEYFGGRHRATVAEEPLFDPAMKRMRA